MARIFSWKITNGKYAYLVKDEENNSYIRNRVSDKEKLLQFSKIILGFSENQYMTEYNKLRDEVLSLYGKDIGSDYSIYYDTGDDNTTNKLILLSGKDGENGKDGKYSNVITEKELQVLNSVIDHRIDDSREQENLLSKDIKDYIENAVSVNMNATMQSIHEANSRLNTMETKFDDVINKNDIIIGSIETFKTGTQSGIADLLTQTSSMKSWLDSCGDSVSGMIADYNDARGIIGAIAGADPSQGVFKNIGGCFNNVTNKISNVETKCQKLSGTVENISKAERIDTEPIEFEEVVYGKSSMEDDYDDEIKLKTSVTDNEFTVKYGDNAFISLIDGIITLQSGDFGLKITNDGIKVRKKGGDYTDAKL